MAGAVGAAGVRAGASGARAAGADASGAGADGAGAGVGVSPNVGARDAAAAVIGATTGAPPGATFAPTVGLAGAAAAVLSAGATAGELASAPVGRASGAAGKAVGPAPIRDDVAGCELPAAGARPDAAAGAAIGPSAALDLPNVGSCAAGWKSGFGGPMGAPLRPASDGVSPPAEDIAAVCRWRRLHQDFKQCRVRRAQEVQTGRGGARG